MDIRLYGSEAFSGHSPTTVTSNQEQHLSVGFEVREILSELLDQLVSCDHGGSGHLHTGVSYIGAGQCLVYSDDLGLKSSPHLETTY